MKRRKMLAASLSIALAVSILTGCSQDSENKRELNAAYFPSEYPVIRAKLDDYTAPSEATVVVNGITYTGTYAKTTQPDVDTFCSSHVYHTYKGDGYEFLISAQNGEFRELCMDYTKVAACTFCKEKCREKADAIADDYISLDDYSVTESIDEGEDGHSYHTFDYSREVSGMKTSDRAIIRFNCNGDLYYVSLMQIGAFENVKSVIIDKETVKKAVEKRVKNDYKRIGKEFSRVEISYGERLIKTEANQCAVFVLVRNYYKTEDGEQGEGKILPMLVIVNYRKHNWFKP